MKLNKVGRRLLAKHHGKLKLMITVIARDVNGQRTTKRKTVTSRSRKLSR